MELWIAHAIAVAGDILKAFAGLFAVIRMAPNGP
jgi:hypothetical protein